MPGKGHFTRRWVREGRLVATLTHPHIAALYDVGEHNGPPCLVMEFVEGVRPQPAKLVIGHGIQLADALAAADEGFDRFQRRRVPWPCGLPEASETAA